MTFSKRRSGSRVILAAVVILSGCSKLPPAAEQAGSDTTFKSANAPYAILWMANAAEYDAICHQTFNTALSYLAAQTGTKGVRVEGKPVAVVMDLDETVLDNFAYMTFLFRSGQGVSWESWNHWEQYHIDDVGLIPGSLDFIRGVESLGAVVCYISNREEPTRRYTVEAMVKLGIIAGPGDVSGENQVRLQLYRDTSDKEARRDRVSERFHVLAYLGDNLGDFPGGFAPKTAAERDRQVSEHKDKWGNGWFVLPNPSYGAWLRYVDAGNPEAYLPEPSPCGPDCPLR